MLGEPSSGRVNVDEFYEQDERRRASVEFDFGLEWQSESDPGVPYAVRWIEATKEVYVLRQPRAGLMDDGSGASPGVVAMPLWRDACWVTLLATAETREILASALAGWEAAMSKPDSVRWLQQRLAEAAAETDRRNVDGPCEAQ